MYIQGFIVPVPENNRDDYIAAAKKGWSIFKSMGALEMVEAWEEDVADGKLTDFRKAVQIQPGEKVVFSWIMWPDRATCDAAGEKMQKDPAMEESFGEMPFDGNRMFWGGFSPVFNSRGLS